MVTQQVGFAGQQYNAVLPSAEEVALLDHVVINILAYGNAWLQDTFRTFRQSIIGALGVAKEKFDAPFRGPLAADNEIGIQLIRPGHILRTTGTSETPQNDWTFTFTADSDYWIGYSTNNTTAVRISQYLLLLPMGVMFTQGNSPTVEELYIQVGPTTYPVQVLRHAWLADNPNRIRAARFHPLLIEPRQAVLAQVYSILAQTQEMALVGLAFGTGRYLRVQEYAAGDLP